MSDSPVLLERDGAVATIVLNRAAQRNALDRGTKEALVAALQEVADDPTVRAVVLTGAGSAFCVGQDLGEHAAALKTDLNTVFDTVAQHYTPIVTALATMPKPVIAAVNGTCVGAGLGFALACDLRVLSAAATFATAFSGIGLTCDSGLSSTLVRSVGEARARELVLLGEPFRADDAIAWGITGNVVAAEEVLPTAQALAARLAAGPTLAYAESKKLLAAALDRSFLDSLTAEGAAQARLGTTADHVDAVAAFLDKRRPEFTGH